MLVAAFSGGRDSVALLYGLRRLQTDLDFALLAAHFNHGLRGVESDGDEQFCRDFCQRLGVELVCGRAADLAGKGENAARDSRYAWLRQVCAEQAAEGYRPVWLVCAHHQDDQAETVLLHLLRGSGTAGLAAMRRRNGQILRPLLNVSRREINAYLAENGLAWREDSSNAGLDYTRNRLRNRLGPLLQQLNPNWSAALAQTAEIAAAEQDFLAECVRRKMRQATVDPEQGAAYLWQDWQKEPLAMRRLLVRALWQAAAQSPVCALSFEHTEAVLNLPLHRTIHLPGGVAVVKNHGWLRFLRLSDEEMQRRRAKSGGKK